MAGDRTYRAELVGGLHDGEQVDVTLPEAMGGPAAGRITFRGEIYRLWLYRVRETGNLYSYVHENYNIDSLTDATSSPDEECDAEAPDEQE